MKSFYDAIMRDHMKKVTLIGSFSGRNAGDTAILGNLLDDFAETRNDIEFLIPTLIPSFVKKQFGHHNVRAMGMMPWHGSLKALGLANYIGMTRTDMVLITDNALFDRKLYNPLINTLWSVALFSPICKKRNIPIVFYNASVGPIDTEVGKQTLQKVLNATELVTLRDKQSQELFERLQLKCPEIHIKADCAINTVPSRKSRLDEIIRDENLFTNLTGTISFNVNAYIDNWSNTGKLTRDDFCRIIAGSIDQVIDKLGVDVLLTVTQVMDLKITKECYQYIKNQSNVRIITNEEYSYHDIVGILAKVGSHIGLRTHSLIFCAAVNTPMVSINSYPKNTGFMRSIGQDEWMIEFDQLNRDNISNMMIKSWQEREQRKSSMAPITDIEKTKAKESVGLVNELLDS
jgi:polysaccharide pyruvyl transferase WcaK-like protein